MKIDNKTIDHIAGLAKLSFSKDKKASFIEDFERLVDFIGKIDELDVENYEPAIDPFRLRTITRPDKIEKTDEGKRALSQAPKIENNLYKVPKVLD